MAAHYLEDAGHAVAAGAGQVGAAVHLAAEGEGPFRFRSVVPAAAPPTCADPSGSPTKGADDEPKAAAEPPPETRRALWLRRGRRVLDGILEHWFLLAIGFAIGFAAALPDFGRTGGWIESQYTIK